MLVVGQNEGNKNKNFRMGTFKTGMLQRQRSSWFFKITIEPNNMRFHNAN
jgi:hypothetical protein